MKLDNKGMTIAELLIGFMIASALAVALTNFILNYSNEEIDLEKKNEIVDYKNIITKQIQTDIIKGEIKNVVANSYKSGSTTIYRFTLNYNIPLRASNGRGNIYSKQLEIHANSNVKSENYIVYDDINNLGYTQKVKYDLPDTECTSSDCTGVKFTRFSSINTNVHDAYNTIDPITNTNYGINYFSLDITISAPEEIGDNHILIVAPLNYRYCKVTNNDEKYYY